MFPDGTHFYPDSQNGKYGFNTDPQRGADTFRPFNDIDFSKLTLLYCRECYDAIRYTYTLTRDHDYILAVAISRNPHSSYDGSSSAISYVSTGEKVCQFGHTLSPGDTAKYGSGCSVLVLKDPKKGDTITVVATVDGAVGIYGF